MNTLPLLQVALDTPTLNSALSVTQLVNDVVDIIEVGTILCLAEGLRAVETIKTLYPDKIVLADVRIAEAGALIAKMVFDAGADWVSILSSASIPTIGAVANEAAQRGRDVQIELQEDWSMEKLQYCMQLGISQVIYHKSRDSEKLHTGWGRDFLSQIKRMSDQGYKISITGNLKPDDLSAFKGIPIFSFVAGRSIRDAENPRLAALEFKRVIQSIW